jgi:hypothetical protein
MNRKELEQMLTKAGVRRDAYCLEGGLPSEAYALAWDGKRWRTYYSERGGESNVCFFETESAACQHLLQLLLADPFTT